MSSSRITTAFLFLLFCTASSAQKMNSTVIKLNLNSLVVKNFAFQGEKAIGKKTSLALGFRFQPYGKLPFVSYLKDQVNDPDVQIENVQLGNIAITPEFRYYLGKKALKGFYVAPYARYANFKMEAPVYYTSSFTQRTANFKGEISSLSAGLLFGSQFHLGKHVTLDLWVLGGHFGSSDGKLTVATPLTPQEQDDLRQTLDNIDIPLFDIKYDINSNGGTITSKGAWAGVRALAINLGIRF